MAIHAGNWYGARRQGLCSSFSAGVAECKHVLSFFEPRASAPKHGLDVSLRVLHEELADRNTCHQCRSNTADTPVTCIARGQMGVM